jgi:peptidoglycan/xylan/chitin deacetylase (PgdA/CDA1 family)
VLSLLFAAQAAIAQQAVVFMYHRFGEDAYPSTNVRMDDFRAQVALLRDGGYTVIPLRELLEALAAGSALPDRSVVLTVDDAYRSVSTLAWPVLREAGVPLSVFVAGDPVVRQTPAMMSWAQMRALAAEGVTFANHGASHAYLVRREPQETQAAWRVRINEDVRRGQARLDDELGATGAVLPGVYAYPYGEYNSEIAALLREQGYVAFGQQSGAVGPLSDRLVLPRFPINEAYSGLEAFRTKADSLPMPVTAIEPWDPLTGPQPELTLRLDGSLAHPDRLACYLGDGSRLAPQWLDPGRELRISLESPLAPGRQRVNCTAPGPSGRYHWFSHQWLVR